MKKFHSGLFILLVFGLSIGTASAKTIGDHDQNLNQKQKLAEQQKQDTAQKDNDRDAKAKEKIDRRQQEMARDILKKTAAVIIKADKSAIDNKHSEKFFKAIVRQRFAKKLYLSKDFESAIFQSLRARQFAILELKDNWEKAIKDDERSGTEMDWEKSRQSRPSDQMLDEQLNKDKDRDMYEKRDHDRKDKNDRDMKMDNRDKNWEKDIDIDA
jgi:hypothetical protein